MYDFLLNHALYIAKLKLEDFTPELSDVFVFISIPYHFLGVIVTNLDLFPSIITKIKTIVTVTHTNSPDCSIVAT